jgi:hypothetical protein
VYLKAVSSAKDDVGYGDGWFKIFDEGYNEDSSEWCTTKRTPTGMLEVKLPEGLKGGEYLARPELLALHNAPEGRPQFFTGCFQIKVDGDRGNGLVPEETVRIPGYVKGDDKSVTFNIYSEGSEAGYTTPGPELAKLIVK